MRTTITLAVICCLLLAFLAFGKYKSSHTSSVSADEPCEAYHINPRQVTDEKTTKFENVRWLYVSDHWIKCNEQWEEQVRDNKFFPSPRPATPNPHGDHTQNVETNNGIMTQNNSKE